jgi:uroporphyrin-III C-methyltransferase/precorrin-2 dehydrogenase/sirohydrochlorin ferrochelatase
VITGTLDTLPDKSTAADIKSPALIIVGSVVTLQDKLSWFSDTGAPAE